MLEILDFGEIDVCEGGDGVMVERGEGDLVKVDEVDFVYVGVGEGGVGVGVDVVVVDDDYEGIVEFGEVLVGEEDVVVGELFEDEFVVEVVCLGVLGEEEVVFVFFVGFGEGVDVGELGGGGC